MTAPMSPRLLEGVRVIDLTWILVGTGATCLLASMGAEVMRIEPTDQRRVDLARYVPPFLQDTPGPSEDPYGMSVSLRERFDRAGYYLNNNPGRFGPLPVEATPLHFSETLAQPGGPRSMVAS